MVFCPHCHVENPNVPGLAHCVQCNRSLNLKNPEMGKPSGKSSAVIYIVVGVISLFLLTLIVGFVALFFAVKRQVLPALANTNPNTVISLDAFEGDLPAEAEAAFSRRAQSAPAVSLDQVAEGHAEFPVPEIGQPKSLGWANLYLAKFGGHLRSYSSNDPAGARTVVRMYVPVDLADDAKIPCVLLAPAGSNLLTGKDCDDLDYADEIRPYVTAGMAVVHDSLDGSLDKIQNERIKEKALPGAFDKFCKAHGGVVNGQRALDFALGNFQQIDPNKLYCAGHSSAATLSLQLASTDQRISKCVAYAPAPSLKKRFAELFSQDDIDLILPRFRMYVEQWSPENRISKFNCPVFIFHALDDGNTPYPDTKAFHDQLVAEGKATKLVTGKRGGHYQSMIDEGIPAAIDWLKSD